MAPGSGGPQPNARRRGAGPAAIRLPPLSSPGNRPPQRRAGREAFANCRIGPQGGGCRRPVTPESGYRPWIAPECFVQDMANGQLSTVHEDARRERRGFCDQGAEGPVTVPTVRRRRRRDAKTPPRRGRRAAEHVFWTPRNGRVRCDHGAASRKIALGRSTCTARPRHGHAEGSSST